MFLVAGSSECRCPPRVPHLERALLAQGRLLRACMSSQINLGGLQEQESVHLTQGARHCKVHAGILLCPSGLSLCPPPDDPLTPTQSQCQLLCQAHQAFIPCSLTIPEGRRTSVSESAVSLFTAVSSVDALRASQRIRIPFQD